MFKLDSKTMSEKELIRLLYSRIRELHVDTASILRPQKCRRKFTHWRSEYVVNSVIKIV